MLVSSPIDYFSTPLINFDLLDDDLASHYTSDIFAHLKESEVKRFISYLINFLSTELFTSW